MAVKLKGKNKSKRKIGVMIMLTEDEIKYLDRKIPSSKLDQPSRSALIRYLIRLAIEKVLL